MKALQPLLVFLSIIFLFPITFGLAYFLWEVNHVLALTILFIGLSLDILGGFELLDRIMRSS
ncbi:MAG: hypothetical protein Kow00121_05760 [Elainellaceae cyanobacterium]